MNKEILLDVQHVTKSFPITRHQSFKALDDVSFQMKKGEIFGLVGESGSGKSTLARCIMNQYHPDDGQILYQGINTCNLLEFKKNKKLLQTTRQFIFQDSTSSLNPKMQVGKIIGEPLKIHHRKPKRGSIEAEVKFQMKYVGLDQEFYDKYPSELSGGQRQRVAIARAVSMEPWLLIADEPIASLDVSIQAQIVNLFKHLQKEHGFSILFISHDLSMVEFLCDRIGVLKDGKMLEILDQKDFFQCPKHPYTKKLVASIPKPNFKRSQERDKFL